MTEETNVESPAVTGESNPGVAEAAPGKKKDKKPPPGLVIPPKKPKLTKAERRALQEKQRAAKAVAQGGQGGKHLQPTPKKHVLTVQQAAIPNKKDSNTKSKGDTSTNTSQNGSSIRGFGSECLDLFSHLPQYKGKCLRVCVRLSWL